MLNGNIGEILWGGRTEKCAVQKSSALREKGHELYLVEIMTRVTNMRRAAARVSPAVDDEKEQNMSMAIQRTVRTAA
jgi:methionine synthase I (cobalamin-dependent)